MKIGSRTVLRITDTIIAYIALFMSPSPRRIPLPPFPNMNAKRPKNKGVPYLIPSANDCPLAPYALSKGSCMRIRIMVSNMDAIRNIKREWAADWLAPSWFFAPTKRLMLLVAPFPSPTLTPFRIMNIGVTNPIPAIAA